MVCLVDPEKQGSDVFDIIVLFCLFTVRACSPQEDKVFEACLNTTAEKECFLFLGKKMGHGSDSVTPIVSRFYLFSKGNIFFFVQKNYFLAGFAPGEVEGFNVTMLNGSLEGDQSNWPWNQSAIGMENTRPL